MFCSKCGFKLEDNARFCSKCGSPTAQVGQSSTNNIPPQQPPNFQNKVATLTYQQNYYQQPHFMNPSQPVVKKKTPVWIALIAAFLVIVIIVLAVFIGSSGKSSSAFGSTGGIGTSNSSPQDPGGSNKDEIKIGDIIEFGEYEQDGNYNNGSEPIEWIVLDKDGEKLLLISRYVLDAVPYTYSKNGASWEDSVVYDWLIDGFYNSAFSYQEYERITCGTVQSEEESYLATEPCFALSTNEIQHYAENASDLFECSPTEYAAAEGVVISSDENYPNSAYWYVRDKFAFGTVMAPTGVSWVSQVYKEDKYGLRPALWITEEIGIQESFVSDNRDYANSKICGAESIEELIEILNNNEYISEETIYAMPPMVAALFAYGEDDYTESVVDEISQKTCAQIKSAIDSNGISAGLSGGRIHISDYKKLNESQINYTKQSMHSDSFGWFDDVEEIWQTTGYVTEEHGRQELEYMVDDENDGDFDCTLGIIKKGGRYYWFYTGNW